MTPRFALGTALLGLFAVSMAVEQATVGDVLKDPSKYDGKDVSVTGTVEDFVEKTSGGGNAYTTLKVKDGDKRLTIWLRGHVDPKPANGDTVMATGVFAKERKVGDVVYKNELDATAKARKDYGIRILKSAGG